jgi:ABC-2 type transport system ATP-binding protein
MGVSKRYGEVAALSRCSFRVRPGRLTGFVGPNGAGKTTAMRAVFGLVTPDAGTVCWQGRPVSGADRRGFGYMPEERGLYLRMRVADQLVHLGRLSGLTAAAAAREADRWLDALGLADRKTSRLDDLSHGNQQRVQLAAALVHSPDLLVLDEPFSGLDPRRGAGSTLGRSRARRHPLGCGGPGFTSVSRTHRRFPRLA